MPEEALLTLSERVGRKGQGANVRRRTHTAGEQTVNVVNSLCMVKTEDSL